MPTVRRFLIVLVAAFLVATAPASATTPIQPEPRHGAVGVHGWKGRWLVISSTQQQVAIDIDPPQPGFFNGLRLRLRRVVVSPDDPEGLTAALR